MSWTTSQGIVATVLYASLFDYPLTEEEIRRWYIYPSADPPKISNIKKLRVIQSQGIYFSDKFIKSHVLKRLRRQKYSIGKWNIVFEEAKKIQRIPGVMLLGISGGLSMNNAEDDEDIDLFIICRKGTIWSTRILVLLLLSHEGKRRRYGVLEQRDLLCPNMFISDTALQLPKRYRDIYTAHEILQMEPVFVRGDTYVNFLNENNWTQTMLPYAWKWRMKHAKEMNYVKFSLAAKIGCFGLSIVNGICKHIQLYIMKNHRTSETGTDTVMRFHPKDMRNKVNKKFKVLLTKYDIPLDSEFF